MAVLQGKTTFVADEPCKHGHYIRRVDRGLACAQCLIDQKPKANAYASVYRKANPERVHDSVRGWQKRNKEKMRTYSYRLLAKKGVFPKHRIREIKSYQQEAEIKGYSNFSTGQPCVNGHWSARDTKDAICIMCKLSKKKGST